MGRVIHKEVIAFRCNLRSCAAQVPAAPRVPFGSTWHDQCDQLRDLVAKGWSFVLVSQMRCYCPSHAECARSCTCRTHPTRKHTCTEHDLEAAGLVWDSIQTPSIVSRFLEVVR